MRITKVLLLFLIIVSCASDKIEVDTIITNGTVYTVDADFNNAEAFAIKDGKFVAVGTTNDINKKYKAINTIDAKGQTILPGFIDAHCHFYGLGLNQLQVNLRDTKSFDEVMKRVIDFHNNRPSNFIIGRGWDQNDWDDKTYPNKALLDKLYPDTPVALTRIDGHAMLCNQAALDLAKIDVNTTIEGGEILKKDGQLTGVLIDNPMELVEAIFPEPTKQQQIDALLEAHKICTELGLTTVSDAGLDKQVIQLIDSLQQAGTLDMRMYAMISNKKENLEYYLSKGKIKTDRLNVQSVKVYADGALGSRGAALKQEYSDQHDHFGALVIGTDAFINLAEQIAKAGYQMNTHAIGDSANRFVLQTYQKTLKDLTNRRWRVEHAQIITDNDFDYFKNENIIPSIQPTHATSDMYWAEDRLGKDRIKGAYAYKTLLEKSGRLALGTDFPVEQVSPFLTFYAAVSRQDVNQFPAGGFNKDNGLTREETLKGMTIWAAYANFEEEEKGSIEAGKFADFIILDNNIMTIEEKEIPNIKVNQTYINGVAQ
ncbi:amidohydrolase [Olleya sp. UBA1516]|mgnify:FL=1|uniref:amidohydrolase n=1 Tax=Olleya sp. UBA1516 TaxID=1947013 RepID=UPI0025F7EF4B|nr:amidohydrolase [Olleya sp. UBA1516]|tara:strand:+ start:39188 stop:40810 length:1623 start_codon:yes stop_codon:yes gene_type:complete